MRPKIQKYALYKGYVLPVTLLCACLLLGVAFWQVLAKPNASEVELAGYATSLNGRTASQRHNARRAAEALNGTRLLPNATFSFNRLVKSWTWDQGYVKAPVSYDGELIRAYGGGVCQTSTTLYNAVLLAGLPIIERHSHVFAPRYVPPGRDAAVAQYDIDLRFKNPYPFPLKIRAKAEGDRLEVRIIGAEASKAKIEIVTNTLSRTSPVRLTRIAPRASTSHRYRYLRNPGAVGYRVVSYRVFREEGREVRRERLSDDSYQAMDRIVQIHQDEVPSGF